jgi:transposase
MARRPANGGMSFGFLTFAPLSLGVIAAVVALLTTLTLVLFVQLADESRGLSHRVVYDLGDDLAKTFAASWATLDKTNSQMSFPRLSISTSPSKVLQTVFISLPHSLRLDMPRKKKSSAAPPPSCCESTPPCLQVGIDWADAEHAYAMRDPNGKLHRGSFKQTPEAIADLLGNWEKLFPRATIVVCIETKRGALINALLDYSTVQIIPVNPNQLASYRKSFKHGGGKSDPVDAMLILQFLENYRHKLRPLEQDSAITRELALLTYHRRELVNQRVNLSQQLIDVLKCYFPLILLLNPSKIYADWVVAMIIKWPTLQQLQSIRVTTVRKFLFGRGAKKNIELRIELIKAAKPLSSEDVLLRTSTLRALAMCQQLAVLNETIREYQRQITALLRKHADYKIVKSLPCGDISRARILAALGDDRSRYKSASQLASATGIAPLTEQSGKQRFVHSRWACSHFMRQTFHEFARVSVSRCDWAKAFYDSQIESGKSAQMAHRALAYKWIRILFRCWQTGKPYVEERYVARLIQTNSPIAKRLTELAISVQA